MSGRRYLRPLALGFAAFLASSPLAAQDGVVGRGGAASFAILSLKDGLANDSVSGIVQDSKGFIWLGTQGGLCRYDGSDFLSFENEPFVDDCISSNLIQTLYLDANDALWIGTYNGLDRFDPETKRFTVYRSAPNSPDSLSNDLIIAIARDARHRLWVGTLDGLDRLDEKTGRFVRYFHDRSDPHSIPNNTVRALFCDSKGELWVGTTGGGLARYDYGKDRFDNLPFAPETKGGLPKSLSIQSIAEDSGGDLWLGAWGRGLLRYSPGSGTFKVYPLPDNRLYVVNTRQKGIVLAGTWGGGLFALDTATGALRSWRRSSSLGSLPNDVVYSLLVDASGELWVGTNGGGLARMDRTRSSFKAYASDPKDPGALPSGKTTAAIVDSRGRLWVAVYGQGINELDPATGAWRHFRHRAGDPSSLGDDICNCFLEDREGRFWVGTNDGLSLMDRRKGTFVTYRHKNGDPDSLSSSIVNSLLEDPEGRLWIGTYLTGLDRWDIARNVFEHHSSIPSDPDSISDNLVNALAYDGQGRLWVGTNNGLDRLEGKRFVRYRYDPRKLKGISNDSIESIVRDSTNTLWIATRGGGLMRYHPESDSFDHFTRADGLPNNIVYSVLEDRSGELWIVTQTGIAVYDRRSGAIRRVSLYKEIDNASFNSGSCAGPDGRLYFGSVGLVTEFDPELYRSNTHVPPVYVTSFVAANRSKLASPLEDNRRTPIRLASFENSIEIRFAALDFRDPGANQFSYKLEGFDKLWTGSRARNFATYTNLPGGRYVFRVRAANNDGLWNERGASLYFTVATPPLFSLPAIIAYLLAIAAAGYGLASLRANRLLADKLRQLILAQTALREAEREAKKLAEDAEAANRAKTRFIAVMSHEIRTPMSGVLGMTELLARTALDDRQRDYLATIRSSGETLLSVINEVLDYSKIEAQRLVLEEVPFEIRELVENARRTFLFHASVKSIELSASVAAEVPAVLRGDPTRLAQILVNLTGNAVKFTNRGGVRIEVVADSAASETATETETETETATAAAAGAGRFGLRIRVADTGIGIEAGKIPGLFTPYSQADGSTTRRFGGTGLGLSISKRLVELMGGRIEVESVPGSGSVFTVFVSLGLAPEKDSSPAASALSGPGEEPDPRPAKGARVLVVDDDDVSRRVAAAFSAELGASADQTDSGEAALEKLAGARYDLVLLDSSLSGMDGAETARRIREGSAYAKNRGTPIVMMTASTDPEERESGLRSGMDDFVAKPLTLRSLAETFRRLLSRSPAEGGVPDSGPAEGGAPEGGAPEGGAPDDGAPEGGVPDDGGHGAAPTEESSAGAEAKGAEAPVFAEAEFAARYETAPELAVEVLDMFALQSRSILVEALEAAGRGKREAVRSFVHRLKGICGAMCGERAAGAAETVLTALRDDPETEGLAELKVLDAELKSLEDAIAAYRGRDGL